MFTFAVLILVIVAVLSALTIFIVIKKPEWVTFFKIVFAFFILVFSVLIIKNIMRPIKFTKERVARESAAIDRLNAVRVAQVAYKDKYGHYTNNFDTLIGFISNDSIAIQRFEQISDWDQDEVPSRDEAVKLGILKRAFSYRNAMDSLFGKKYPVNSIRFIPVANIRQFTLDAGELTTTSDVEVNVFEAYALYKDLFMGMDRQMVINYVDERYKTTGFEGIKVGSMTEANNNAGNWE